MLVGGIIGFALGGLCGIGLMCMFQINAQEEDHDEDM